MQKSSLYPPIYVLGDGQLGRMLRYAGAPLDIDVRPMPFHNPPFELEKDCLITAEIERWDKTPLTDKLSSHPHFINHAIFAQLADRLTQKRLLDELGLATSPWIWLQNASQKQSLFEQLGERVMVKRRTGGYDGRGQWVVSSSQFDELPTALFGEVIAEKFIPFDGEVSLVGARFRDGSTRFYPLTHNLQQQGILRYSVMNPDLPKQAAFQRQAETMLGAIMARLDYVGVMAMECFVVGDDLLINELAPRVHNSGHWTQLGCSISQFELHLRALLDLPTPALKVVAPCVMVNLIGIEHHAQWLELPFSQLHWYGKVVREGRKVGHINLCHSNKATLIELLYQLKPQLSGDFASGLDWAVAKLA